MLLRLVGLLGAVVVGLVSGVVQAAPRADCQHRLVFANQTGQSVDFALQGQSWKLLGAGKRAFVCQTATVHWQVRDPAGQWLQHGQTPPQLIDRQVVVLQAPPGAVRLVNVSPEPVLFALDGSEHPLVAPGQSLDLALVPAGRHLVSMTGSISRKIELRQVDVRAGQTTRVATARGRAQLKIRNDRDEPVELVIDAVRMGVLQPGEAVTFGGLRAGDHRIERIGQKTGRRSEDVAEAVELSADASQTQVAEERQPTFALTVVNRTGETLQIPDMLRPYAADLPADASATWLLPRGTYGFDLRGADSGLGYHRDVLPRTAAVQSWSIARPRALLRLQNDDLEPLRVVLAEGRAIDIPARSHALLRVPAGRWKLRAEPKGRPSQEEALFLQPFSEVTWRMDARPTAIVVHNAWPEPLQLWVGDVQSGEVEPGSDRRLPLPPGRHALFLRARWSGQVREVEVALRAGELQTVTLTPPGGVLALDNRGNPDPLTLRVDGGEPLEVPAGARQLLPVGAGQHLLEVRVGEDPRAATALVRVRPGAHLDVPGVALTAVAYAVNCSGQTVYLRAASLPDAPMGNPALEELTLLDRGTALTVGPRGPERQLAWAIRSKDRRYVWLLRPAPDRDDAELHLVLPGMRHCKDADKKP